MAAIKYNVRKNALRNTAFGATMRLISMVGAFATRTVLIYTLGVEYVGLDGLFASILTLLNMAELGFSSAVVFKLYKPIAENDIESVCAFLKYYRSVYRCIGIFVLGFGLIILPLLPSIVEVDKLPESVNIYVLYLIYLCNSSLTYLLFAHKSALLNAHQRNDLVSKASSVAELIKYTLQILLLLLVHNYYVYVIVIPLFTIANNLFVAYVSKKKYPQYSCGGKISYSDKKEIKEKVLALLYNKVGIAIINGSDNIVISKFLGLTVLGVYSLYYYIFTILHNFFDVFHTAITAGIGNKIVTESREDNYRLFNNLIFINCWAVGWVSICLFCLYIPFMNIWVGEGKSFSLCFSILMSVYFYFWMIRFIVLIFKNAQGLWREDRFRSIIEGFFNLGLNIFLVQLWGIYGIVISTIIAMLLISIPWETKVLFKCYFKESTTRYYAFFLMRFLITVVTGYTCYLLCDIVNLGNMSTFVIRLLICIIYPNIVFCCVYQNTDGFRYLKGSVIDILNRIKK